VTCSQHSQFRLSTGWVGGRGVRELVRSAWRAYWEHRAERATAELLRLIDAHALREIGLDRSELEPPVPSPGDCRGQGDCPCRERRQAGSGNGRAPHTEQTC